MKQQVWHSRWQAALGGFLLLVALEFLLFDQVGAKHHTQIFPRWNDQVQYLTESYLTFEDAKTRGIVAALAQAIINPSAQGTLHDAAALLVFSVAGPSRSAALSLNMVAFLAWQTAVFWWCWRTTRVASFAFLAAGMLLLLRSPWMTAPGSAFDFRLDWFAACGLGISAVVAHATAGFRHTALSVLFGVVVGVTIATRFVTGAYFAVAFAALAIVCVAFAGSWKRLLNLLLSGFVSAALAGPVLWLNRTHLYNYYFVGHFRGPESGLRALGLSAAESFTWVLDRFFTTHVGAAFLWTAALLVIALAVCVVLCPVRPRDVGFAAVPERANVHMAFVFWAAPLLVLALHVQKTEQVLGAALGGFFLLIILLLRRLFLACAQPARLWISGTFVALAIGHYATGMWRSPHDPSVLRDARAVARVADYVAQAAANRGWSHPRLAVDRIVDGLDGQILRVVCYERSGRWIPFVMTLPTGIYEEKVELYWERLQHSDFVILTAEGDAGRWPYDRQLAELRPQTHAWAEERLHKVESFEIAGARMMLFERK
jgi:hypothetical protein